MKKILIFCFLASSLCSFGASYIRYRLAGFEFGDTVTFNVKAGSYSSWQKTNYSVTDYDRSDVIGVWPPPSNPMSITGSATINGVDYDIPAGNMVNATYINAYDSYVYIDRSLFDAPDNCIIELVTGDNITIYDSVVSISGVGTFINESYENFPLNYGAVAGGSRSISINGSMYSEYGILEPFEWSGSHDFLNGSLVLNRQNCFPSEYDPYVPPAYVSGSDIRGDGSIYYSRSLINVDGSSQWVGEYHCVLGVYSNLASIPTNYTIMSSGYNAASSDGGNITFILGSRSVPAGWSVEFQHCFYDFSDDGLSEWFTMGSGYTVLDGDEYFFDFDLGHETIGVTDPYNTRVYVSWYYDDIRTYRFILRSPEGFIYPAQIDGGGEHYIVMPIPSDPELNPDDDDWDLVPVNPPEGGLPSDPIVGNPVNDDDFIITPPTEPDPNPVPAPNPSPPGSDPTLPPADPGGDIPEYLLNRIADNTFKTSENSFDGNQYLSSILTEGYKNTGYLSNISEYQSYQSLQLSGIASILAGANADGSADSAALTSIKDSALTDLQYSLAIRDYMAMVADSSGSLANGFVEWKSGNDSWIIESRGNMADELAFQQRIAEASENSSGALESLALSQLSEFEQWQLANQSLSDLLTESQSRSSAEAVANQIIDEMNTRHASDSSRDTDYQIAQQAWASTVLGEFDTIEEAFSAQGLVLTDTEANTADLLVKVSELNSYVADSVVQLERQTTAVESTAVSTEELKVKMDDQKAVSDEHLAESKQQTSYLSAIASKDFTFDSSVMESLLSSINDELQPIDDVPFDPDNYGTNDLSEYISPEKIDLTGSVNSLVDVSSNTVFALRDKLSAILIPSFPTGIGKTYFLVQIGGSSASGSSASVLACSASFPFSGFRIDLTPWSAQIEEIRAMENFILSIAFVWMFITIMRSGVA